MLAFLALALSGLFDKNTQKAEHSYYEMCPLDELPQTDRLPSEKSGQAGPPSQHSFSTYDGDQFNALYSVQNVTKGSGIQFPGNSGNVNINMAKNDPDPKIECLIFLDPPQSNDQICLLKKTQRNTCEWLLKHGTFTNWLECSKALLWIRGKPGSGKSTLMSYAVNEIRDGHSKAKNTLVLSFLFNARGTELQRTPMGLFRSLLYQLIEAKSVPKAALTSLIESLHQKSKIASSSVNSWPENWCQLLNLFQSALLQVLKTNSVLLFVDALDECGEDNAKDLINTFNSLLESITSGVRFHICFTCRHYPILDLDGGVFEIVIEEENGNDIKIFVEDELGSFSRRKPSKIPNFIIEHANGVFLWARLAVDQVLDLEKEGEGIREIEKRVQSTPQELNKVYRALIKSRLSNSQKRLKSLKLVRWICFATRPLSLDELRWAIYINNNFSIKSLNEKEGSLSTLEEMAIQVNTHSCGLAEVTANGTVVQFIHQSVKEFFIEEGLSVLDYSGWFWPTISNLTDQILGQIGLSVLNCAKGAKQALYQLIRKSFIKKYPGRSIRIASLGLVLALPSKIWHYPLRTSIISASVLLTSSYVKFGNLFRNIKAEVLVTTANYELSEVCIQYLAMKEITLLARSRSMDKPLTDTKGATIPSRFPFLHYAAISWVAHFKQSDCLQETLLHHFESPTNTLMETWVYIYNNLENYSQDCPPENTTLVHILARYQMKKTLEAFLNRGNLGVIDINAKDSYGWTPLSLAASEGNETIVRLLIDRGASAEIAGEFGWTPLIRVAAMGLNRSEAVAQRLLDSGASILATDELGRTELSWAAGMGNTTLVRLLLERGARIEAEDIEGRTPLLWAAIMGEKAVMELLLSSGATIEAADKTGRTALSWAAGTGYKAAVLLLLKMGARIEVTDKDGQTPLLWASRMGHSPVVRLLLDKGASIEAADKNGQTALSWAAAKGNTVILQLLSKKMTSIQTVEIEA